MVVLSQPTAPTSHGIMGDTLGQRIKYHALRNRSTNLTIASVS